MAYLRFSCSDWYVFWLAQNVDEIDKEILRISTIEKEKDYSFKELNEIDVKKNLISFFETNDLDEVLEAIDEFKEDMIKKYGDKNGK